MPVEISIIIPVFNEADNILPLASETLAAMSQQRLGFEVLFVDDASTDSTWERIREAHRLDPCVRGLRHLRNGGQSAAIWTGLQATHAPLIATLDGDRQNDPADLPRLLAQLDTFDFVSGMRLKREDNLLRRASSHVARWARTRALKVDFRDTGCGIRAFKRTVLASLFPFNGLHRLLPVLVHAQGAKTLEVPVNHRPRVAGVSKYGLWNRLWRGLYDLMGVNWLLKRSLLPIPTTATLDEKSERKQQIIEPAREF